MRMQKRLGLFCAGAACVLAAACAKAPAPESTGKTSADLSAPNTPTINTFVVYAANNVTLGAGDHSLGGDIGVGTTAGASPQLTVGSGDLLDNLHTLFAPSISVGNLAIAGPVDTNALTNNGGQVGTQSSYPASMPPLPAVFARTPGTTNVTVAQGQQQTLSPGPYGALTDNGIVFPQPWNVFLFERHAREQRSVTSAPRRFHERSHRGDAVDRRHPRADLSRRSTGKCTHDIGFRERRTERARRVHRREQPGHRSLGGSERHGVAWQ
ncbi:MAG: hypothetical protein ACLP1X_16935 [Polyangiaceae bacterium]